MKRLLEAAVVLIAALTLAFVLVRLSGDPTHMILSPDATESVRMDLRRSLGLDRPLAARELYILARHIFPNNLPSVTVLVSFNLASAIITESGLSFVGLGVPGSVPSWGRMLSEGRDNVATAWWLPVFPGLAIFLTVLAINLIGDYLREVIDPRLRT